MTYQVVEFLKRNFLSLCVKGGGAEVIWAMPESKQWCSLKLSRDSLWPGSRTEWRVWSKTETRLNSGPRAGGHCADTQRSCSQFCPFLPQFVPLPLDQFRNPLEPLGTFWDYWGLTGKTLWPTGTIWRDTEALLPVLSLISFCHFNVPPPSPPLSLSLSILLLWSWHR